MSEKIYDAVIIGSGFGGSINALRLAEAGREVLVLERGKRYEPKDFPRDVRDTDKLLWRYPDDTRARGLFDAAFEVFDGKNHEVPPWIQRWLDRHSP